MSENIVIPKAQYLESLGLKIPCPYRILFRFIGMLPAIKFDHQPRLETHKIDDIMIDRALTPEFDTKYVVMP